MAQPKSYHLPDLVALCGTNFELRTNRHCRQATIDVKKWTAGILDTDGLELMSSMELGLLTSLCYPTCDFTQLVVITKFFTLLLYWKSNSWDLRLDIFDR